MQLAPFSAHSACLGLEDSDTPVVPQTENLSPGEGRESPRVTQHSPLTCPRAHRVETERFSALPTCTHAAEERVSGVSSGCRYDPSPPLGFRMDFLPICVQQVLGLPVWASTHTTDLGIALPHSGKMPRQGTGNPVDPGPQGRPDSCHPCHSSSLLLFSPREVPDPLGQEREEAAI